MARGRLMHQWDQTAELWVALAEPNRDTKKRPKPFTIFDRHPYRKREDYEAALPSVSKAKVFFQACQAPDP